MTKKTLNSKQEASAPAAAQPVQLPDAEVAAAAEVTWDVSGVGFRVPRFLVRLWYRVPQKHLSMMFGIT